MTSHASASMADVTFIGAGPSGVFGAFYAGLRKMSVCVIDNLPQAGGQLMALYPEKMIYDVPSHPAIGSHFCLSDLDTERHPERKAWIRSRYSP